MLMFPKKGQRKSATDNSGCCAIYKQYVNSKNAVFLKRNTVFFYSTIFYFIYFNVVKNYIISSKSAPRKKGLRSFSIRGNCRSPPPVLRFLKFGKEGGQAYGKGIQNPGLQEDVSGGRRGSDQPAQDHRKKNAVPGMRPQDGADHREPGGPDHNDHTQQGGFPGTAGGTGGAVCRGGRERGGNRAAETPVCAAT